jgi:hypothetical protein
MADFAPAPYTTTLQGDVTQKGTVIADPGIAVGSSGIVLHAFDDKHKAIIATAVVTDKKDGKLTIAFQRFKRLKQSALPEYKIEPKAGDLLILNYLYNRVLPIVPDAEHFKSFTQSTKAQVLHPDLFASMLYFDHNPRPDKADFQAICRQHDFNLLYFAVADRGNYVDCTTFKVLYSEPLNSSVDPQKAQKPFYSRIPNIKNRLGGIMGGETIGDYNRYYGKLLQLEK